MIEATTLIVSIAALLIAATSLAVASSQLREAQTANGGRGMVGRIWHPSPDDLGAAADYVAEAMVNIPRDCVVLALDYKAVGPAIYYEVLPYSWGDDGASHPQPGTDPTPVLTSHEGPITAVFVVQRDLVHSIRLGVVWSEPYRGGIQGKAVRFTLDGMVEEWRYYPRLLTSITGGRLYGRWVTKPDRVPRFGPVSQPWEHPRELRKRKKRGKAGDSPVSPPS